MKRNPAIYLTLLLLLTFPGVSAAETDPQAQQYYDQGIALYNKGDFTGAAGKFETGLNLAAQEKDTRSFCVFAGNLGLIYANLGEYKKALFLYDNALKLAKDAKESKSEAMIYTNLGGLYDLTGCLDKAADSYRSALEIFRKAGDPKGIRTNVGNLGIIYDKLGDHMRAVTYFRESIKMAGEIHDTAGAANMLVNLGIACVRMGDYHTALKNYEDALKKYGELHDKKGVSDVYLDFGSAYSDLGDYGEALRYLNDCLEIKTELKEKKGIAGAVMNIGAVYERQGNPEKALGEYLKAYKMLSDMGVPSEQIEAKMADAYLDLSKFGEAQKIYEKLGDPIRLGRLELARKNYDTALVYFDSALRLNAGSRDTMMLFAAYCGKGKAYLGKGYKEAAEARECFEKAIMYNEEQRETLSEQERARFFADSVYGFYRTEPYEGIIELLYGTGDTDEAFTFSESLKARILSESLAAKQNGINTSISEEYRVKENNIDIALRAIRKVMQSAAASNEVGICKALDEQLKDVLDSRTGLISVLRENFPEYAALVYPQPAKPSEIKLEKGEVLLEFEVCARKTYVFVLAGKSLKMLELDIPKDELKKLVTEYRDSFENMKSYNNLADFNVKLSGRLYDILLSKALKNVKDGASLIIVPDEFLGTIPFESLATDTGSGRKMGEGPHGPFPLGVKYVADRCSVSYAQSATTLAMRRAKQPAAAGNDSVLLVCDPIFSRSDPRVEKLKLPEAVNSDEKDIELKKMGALSAWGAMGVSGVKDKGGAGVFGGEELFPRLEKTSRLVETAGGIFGAGNITAFCGMDAAEQKIMKTDLKNFSYVIFATHGILDNTVPWIREPALVLTQIGNKAPYDGFLTMSRIMNMKIPAKLVLLLACRTGIGENVSGEGVMGLGRAFQFAGCSNTVMSLWSVNEDATVVLTAEMLKNLKAGVEPKLALKMAKDKMRQDGWEHPFYWSAFVIY